MVPNFSKNAILNGLADFFCLPCEVHLRTLEETEQHVTNITHIKNLDIVTNISELTDDCIKKIRNKYFCELCNKLFSVIARARLHIKEPIHIENKCSYNIKRRGEYIVAYNKMVIYDESWNGLCDDSCVICNIEYDNADFHKGLSSHILNLIQMKIEFDDDKNMFRKIDETSFQCLICNTVHTQSCMKEHFVSHEHETSCKTAHELHKELMRNNIEKHLDIDNNKVDKHINTVEVKHKSPTHILKQVENPKPVEILKTIKGDTIIENIKPQANCTFECNTNNEEKVTKEFKTSDYIMYREDNEIWCVLCNVAIEELEIKGHLDGKHHKKLLKKHMEHQEILNNNNESHLHNASLNQLVIRNNRCILLKNRIIIDDEYDKAFCVDCMSYLKFDHKIIQSHILEHKNSNISMNVTNVSENSQPKLQGEEKDPLNNKTIVSHDESLKETEVQSNTEHSKHDNGATILNGPLLTIVKYNELVKVASKSFIKTTKSVDNLIFKDIIINERFCINQYCYFFVVPLLDGRLNCLSCEKTLPMSLFESHIKTQKHEDVLSDALIIEMDMEFIRQIPSSYYQCGFCNHFENTWDGMDMHLQSVSHKEGKASALWRLLLSQLEIDPSKNYQNTSNESLSKFFDKKGRE